MAEKFWLIITEPIKSVFFTMVNRRRLRICPNMALCMDSVCAQLQNVEVLILTAVILYLARAPLQRAVLCANRVDGSV